MNTRESGVIQKTEIHGVSKTLLYISPTKNSLPRHLLQGSREKGYLITPEKTVQEWHWEGFVELEGKRFIYFDQIEITPFAACLQDSTKDCYLLFDLLLYAAKNNLLLGSGFFPFNAVYITDSGSLLLLPVTLQEILKTVQTPEQRYTDLERWVKPGLQGTEAFLYQLTECLYFAATGIAPIEDADVRENRYKPLPLTMLRKDLPENFSDWITTLLTSPSHQELTVTAFCEKVAAFKELIGSSSYCRTVSQDNYSMELLALQKLQHTRAARKRFLRKHGTVLIITISAIILVSGIAISSIFRALEPPATVGFTPEETIAYYYSGQNKLDSEMIDDTLAKGVKSKVEDMVIFLYVTSKVRSAYEQKDGLIRAEDWIAQGKPPVPATEVVFGITDLSIERISDDTYRTRYILWSPDSSNDEALDTVSGDISQTQNRIIMGIEKTEILTLQKRKNFWEITNIKEISSKNMSN